MEQGNSFVKRVEPLSFSMGCLDGCEQNSESPFSNSIKTSPLTTNSLNRRKVKLRVDRDGVRKSWGPSDKEEGNQEFWASIREPYDFIMGTHLIPDSYELETKDLCSSTSQEMELSWDPEDVSPPYVWSFSEFLDQYNELYEWLIQVQLKLYSHSNPPDKRARMAQQEELNRRTFRRKLFVEQGERVAKKYPLEEEEIKWRVNYLNNKWEQLLSTLTPVKGRTEEVEVELDLAHEEELLCNWLSAMESQIQPITCRLPRGCSLHALQERFKDNQILLKDIEAHGPILKSVIRQYERLASAEPDPSRSKTIPGGANAPKDSSTETPNANSPVSVADTPLPPKSKKTKKTRRSASAVPRRAKSLEKRWHQIYLRSLEWHYYLEGVIANFKEQDLSCSSDSDDEPVTKCRRLSTSSVSSCGSFHPLRRKPRPQGWSDYEANSSEAGSYIEDDYVYMTDSSEASSHKANPGSKKDHPLSLAVIRKPRRQNCTRSRSSMVGIDAMLDAPTKRKDNDSMSASPVLRTSEGNRNLIAVKSKDGNGNTENAKTDVTHNSTQTSRLTEVDRPSPNSGVFDCKHHDTDSDNNNGDPTVVLREEQRITREKRTTTVQRRYRVRTTNLTRKTDLSYDEEVDPEVLQEIIDSAILDQDWLNSNITTDTDDSLVEEEEEGEAPPGGQNQESMDTGSEENTATKDSKENSETPQRKVSPKPCDKESINRLIINVEQLVREPLKDPASISPRSSLKPLSFGASGESKQRRIKQWLNSQRDENSAFAIGCSSSNLQDSCDASGELTTGESEVESDSDCELDVSLATQKGSGDLLLSSENTPTVEVLPSLSPDQMDKVLLRGKKRQQRDQRPCTDVRQMMNTSNQSSVPEAAKKMPTSVSVLSSSESAPNRTQPSSDEMTTKQPSDSVVSSDQCANFIPPVCSDPNHPSTQSPTVSSTVTIPSHSTTPGAVQSTERVSPTLISSGILRRRRIKFRRRSSQLLIRRTDSGSEELLNLKVGGRGKESKWLAYSPYHHSITKSLSSESESVSGCPRVVKSSSFSGGCIGENAVMTSSTEKCLSDSSHVSGRPQPTSAAAHPTASETLEGKTAPLCLSPRTTDGSPIISPRSDQETTHQEDVSSLSEQAWDTYQEFKYLSEPYSEDLDRDAARKLLDFGDDYRKYIDSDGSSFMGLPYRRRRSPHHRKVRAYTSYRNLDSDSDLDDLHHVIEESKSQLSAMENVLEKYSTQATLGLDLSELVATAKTNLKCLQDILRHLEMEAPDLQSELTDVKGIVERWETLQAKAVDRQRQSTQLRQLQRQVKSLRLSMEGVLSRCATFTHPHTLDDPSQIGKKVEDVKALLDETENMRNDLSSLNVMVHRFTSEIGSTFTPLKDEMAELYRLWDETHRRVTGELTRLQNAEATWRLWEEQKTELSEALKQDSDTLKIIDAAIDNGKLTETVTASVHDVAKLLNERRLHPNGNKVKSQPPVEDIGTSIAKDPKCKLELEGKEDRLSDSGTSGYESCSSDDLSERERRLAYLRRLARDLEASLVPGSKAWNDISSTLADAEKELKGLQDHCRNLILRTAETLDPSSKQPRFSSNSKRRSWAREARGCRSSPRVERRSRSVGSRREWIWRVVRAALPFQAALLLLLCVGCLLVPNCCDSVNTLNFSFTPQLRFVHGSPPL